MIKHITHIILYYYCYNYLFCEIFPIDSVYSTVWLHVLFLESTLLHVLSHDSTSSSELNADDEMI